MFPESSWATSIKSNDPVCRTSDSQLIYIDSVILQFLTASGLLCQRLSNAAGWRAVRRVLLAHIDFLDTAIAELDVSLDKAAAPFATMLKRVRTIPGVSVRTAIMLLAECGADMSVFRTAAHLASWAGICPGNNISGGKSRSGRTRHGSVARAPR